MSLIREIVRELGGAAAVAAAVGCTESAVRKWEEIGIADRHWPALIALSGATLTIARLFEANQIARTADLSARVAVARSVA